MSDPIFIECAECNGSAVKAVRVRVFEHGCGFAHDGTDEIPCPECDGLGVVETAGEPITIEDLEQIP